MIKKFIYIIFVLLFSFNNSCDFNAKDEASVDLFRIIKRGKIIAVTSSNAYGYFVHKGHPGGFHYDLLNRLADELGVDAEIITVTDINEMYEMIKNGKADLAAFNLIPQEKYFADCAYTKPIYSTTQVVVQRRLEFSEANENKLKFINSSKDLLGKIFYVRNAAGYENKLNEISLDFGAKIYTQSANNNLSTEDLIQMVAEGDIDYTIAEKNIAELNSSYYYNIQTGPEISENVDICWAVKKSNKKLLEVLDNWLEEYKKTKDFALINHKYFENKSGFRNRLISEFSSRKKGKISLFDEMFKTYSEKLDWDWRLLASLVYQESKFNAGVISKAGAVGLMQMMPRTAEKFGAENLFDPNESMKAGVAYLIYLDRLWSKSVDDPEERIKFILASYNIGPGHIIDAQKLAEKHNHKVDVWKNNVEKYLLMKSKPEYYNDEIVKNRSANGFETVRFVDEILERFEHYKLFGKK